MSAGTAITVLSRIGLVINPTFDSTITNDPQAATIEATINSAILVYETSFTNPITVAITFMKDTNIDLGQSSWSYIGFSYSSYRAALVTHQSTADDTNALAHLASGTGNPVNGNTTVNLHLPLARALGFSAASSSDGTIYLNTPIMNLSAAQTNATNYSLFAVASHEIDEVLGLGSALDGIAQGGAASGPIYPEDLFRYDGTGARSFTTNLNSAAYFSIDGTTTLARFNQYQGGDFGDWYSDYNGGSVPQGTPEVQDAFATEGSTPTLGVELRALDVIGFSYVAAKTNQTITFGALANRTFGEPSFTVSATASSGLPVSFSILSGPATITNGVVTLTNTGMVTVRATQPGNANYNASPYVDQSFTVYSTPTFSFTPSSSSHTLLLSWPTNVSGYTLETTTNLSLAWVAASPLPGIVNGQYAFTNSTTNGNRFFRLKK